ncbi:hypothetical protein ACSBR1_015659 [Camellia fascicularis]
MNYKTFKKLGLKEDDLTSFRNPLFNLNANLKFPIRATTLPIKDGTQTIEVNILVLKLFSSFNVIIESIWLHNLKAILSTYHQLLRFPTHYGIE